MGIEVFEVIFLVMINRGCNVFLMFEFKLGGDVSVIVGFVGVGVKG